MLGNHDYHNNPGGEQVRLAYAKKAGTRWKMPAKCYRFDLGPKENPLGTVIALDSNLPTVSGGKDKKTGKPRGSLTAAAEAGQLAWFEAELGKKRAPFTIVMAHHPHYSKRAHGDSDELVEQWGPLLGRVRKWCVQGAALGKRSFPACFPKALRFRGEALSSAVPSRSVIPNTAGRRP